MAIINIKANDTKTNKEGSINFDMPATLKEASDKWGEGSVYELFKRQAIVQIQSRMRSLLKTNNDVKMAEEWRPDQGAARLVDPLAAAKAALAGMSKEERAAWLKSLGVA